MLEVNKIYNMDCIEGMALLDDKSIDLCVTDAPYWHHKSPISPEHDGSDWNQHSAFGKSELYQYGGR